MGKHGKYCEDSLFISDPLFTGGNSFMSLTLDSAIRFNTEITLEIRPDSLEGLLVHFGQYCFLMALLTISAQFNSWLL